MCVLYQCTVALPPCITLYIKVNHCRFVRREREKCKCRNCVIFKSKEISPLDRERANERVLCFKSTQFNLTEFLMMNFNDFDCKRTISVCVQNRLVCSGFHFFFLKLPSSNLSFSASSDSRVRAATASYTPSVF